MLCKEISPIVEKDLKTIWHPYSKTKKPNQPIHFERGQGCYLYTEDGKRYIDAISSWWVNLHGHTHPHIAEAIKRQSTLLEQVIFADFTHEPAATYAERLLKALGPPFSRVFYSDNGSTAVETALKMAIQYFDNIGVKKRKILCLKGGFYGETFGCMAASGSNAINRPFLPFLFDVIPIWTLEEMQRAFEGDDVICFIYEPLLQGTFGMKVHSPLFLEPLLEIAKRNGALLIADEVLTGFGRLGPLFASSLMTTKPDFICLGKGITGGFLPLGATVCQEKIYRSFYEKTFFHGHSYTANPICLAAANASFDLLNESCELQRKKIANKHHHFCQKWRHHPSLKRIESIGTILVVEYHEPPLSDFFFSHQIIMRPLGNVYYVMPPYCIEEEDLEYIYQILELTWKK